MVVAISNKDASKCGYLRDEIAQENCFTIGARFEGMCTTPTEMCVESLRIFSAFDALTCKVDL